MHRISPASSRGARTLRRQRGTVLVEAALILPLLIMLAMGTIEYGMAWRDRLSVQSSVRSSVRTGASLGNDAQADYNILQNLKSGMGSRFSNTTRIVVYNASAADGSVPSGCLSGSVAGVCNVYVAADASLASTSFGCGAGAKDALWCPTTRVTNIDASGGLDYLGVYITYNHGLITGSFGSGSLTIKDSAVMRVEPQ